MMLSINNVNYSRLSDGLVQIWQASLSQHANNLTALTSLLNSEEQARADKFIYAKHRNNFIIARAILRCLLAQYLQCKPATIVFQQNEHGKLFLDPSHAGLSLEFNLSHAGDVVVYAFVLNRQIGVDVEHIRHDVAMLDIAKRFFATDEQKSLLQLPEDQQIFAFYDCWTRKEAFIKAIGRGLSYPLKNFSVDIYPTQARFQNVAQIESSSSTLQRKAFHNSAKFCVATANQTAKKVSSSLSETIVTKVPLHIHDEQLTPSLWSLFSIPTQQEYCAALVIEGDCDVYKISIEEINSVFLAV